MALAGGKTFYKDPFLHEDSRNGSPLSNNSISFQRHPRAQTVQKNERSEEDCKEIITCFRKAHAGTACQAVLTISRIGKVKVIENKCKKRTHIRNKESGSRETRHRQESGEEGDSANHNHKTENSKSSQV
ncbi:unnamed protein product [Allacma fusca]|uniref:Uncharacterized protein n=1 Tax=Allacma fusca TaxID=39272 RepID=A0A8J2KEY6_9HEXA|nr:unnamed protein product [Allacma fusca]